MLRKLLLHLLSCKSSSELEPRREYILYIIDSFYPISDRNYNPKVRKSIGQLIEQVLGINKFSLELPKSTMTPSQKPGATSDKWKNNNPILAFLTVLLKDSNYLIIIGKIHSITMQLFY